MKQAMIDYFEKKISVFQEKKINRLKIEYCHNAAVIKLQNIIQLISLERS